MTERVQGEDRPDLPIVVGLHFMGADAETTDRALFDGLPGEYRFVFPAGRYEVDGARSWFPDGYYELDAAEQADLLRREADDLARRLDSIAKQYPVAGRVVVVGASQGADLAATLSLLHPGKVTVCLAVAASVPIVPAPPCGTSVPLRLFHGVDDPIVAIEEVRRFAAATGVPLTEYPDVGHEVPAQLRVDLHAAIRHQYSGQ